MKIEVRPITVLEADIYNGAKYPGPGLYQLQDFRLALVYRSGAACCAMVTPADNGISLTQDTPVSSSLEMNDLLKAIAVTRQPDLIMGLVK